MGIKLNFPIFSEELSHVAKTAQGQKGRVLRKKFILPIESWFFTFFHFFFLIVLHDLKFFTFFHFQCDCYKLNVKF
jgi:hypothetical protein